MKTYRSTFEENFKAVPETGPDGRMKVRYVYIGLWYAWKLPPQRLKAVKRLIGAACALSAALFLAGALLASPLNHARYVQFLGMLSIAALVFEVVGTVQFCAAKERMDCMDFRDIRGKMLLAPLIHGALLLCSAAAAVYRIVCDGPAPLDLAVLVCYVCSAILSLVIFWNVRSLTYRTERNEDAMIGLDDD